VVIWEVDMRLDCRYCKKGLLSVRYEEIVDTLAGDLEGQL
jgi:hypothetical protein